MKILAALLGIAVGLGFVVSGLLIMLGTVVPAYQLSEEMAEWQSIPAEVNALSLSPKGVKVSYRFSLSSIDYYNDRIYVDQSKDDKSIDLQHQWYKKLKEFKDNNEPINVWYDPSAPDKSIIDRDIRWGRLIFLCCLSLFLAVCGIFIIYKAITAKQIKKIASTSSLDTLKKQWRLNLQEEGYQESFVDFCEQQKQQSNMPRTNRLKNPYYDKAQPWLRRKEWRSNIMGSGSKKSLYFLWIFSVVWTLLSSSILFVIEDEIYKGNYAVLIGALFPMIGLYLINKAWQKTKLWRRYGDVELELNPFPGNIGGDAGGTLSVNNVEDVNLQYIVELECIYHYSKSGKIRSKREKVRWADSIFPNKTVVSSGVQLTFNLTLPADLPESDIRQVGKYHSWRLRVFNNYDSDNGAYDNLIGEYNIPVFNMVGLA